MSEPEITPAALEALLARVSAQLLARLNTEKRIRMAIAAGASSGDGSSAARFSSTVPLLRAAVASGRSAASSSGPARRWSYSGPTAARLARSCGDLPRGTAPDLRARLRRPQVELIPPGTRDRLWRPDDPARYASLSPAPLFDLGTERGQPGVLDLAS